MECGSRLLECDVVNFNLHHTCERCHTVTSYIHVHVHVVQVVHVHVHV